jgi:hypothetical protein
VPDSRQRPSSGFDPIGKQYLVSYLWSEPVFRIRIRIPTGSGSGSVRRKT